MSDGRPFIPAWLDSLGLEPYAFRVLLSLWSRGDGCWPTVETISRDCGIKKVQTVSACLKQLEQRGLIRRSLAMRSEGRRSNTYKLIVPSGHQSMRRSSTLNGLVPEADASPVRQTDLTLVRQTDYKGTTGKVPHEGLARPPAARARDPLFDALAIAGGSAPMQMTQTAARACAVALAEIRRVTPELDAAEITRRAQAYRQAHPTWTLTPNALSKYWGNFAQRPEEARQSFATPTRWKQRMLSDYPNWVGHESGDDWTRLTLGEQKQVVQALEQLDAKAKLPP